MFFNHIRSFRYVEVVSTRSKMRRPQQYFEGRRRAGLGADNTPLLQSPSCGGQWKTGKVAQITGGPNKI